MPEFKVVLKITNHNNQELPYSVNLRGAYEDYPEDYFRVDENRRKMQIALQEQAGCKIDNFQLKLIIDKWIEEIKEGRRRTTVRLDLPLEIIEPIPEPQKLPEPPEVKELSEIVESSQPLMAKSTPADIQTSEYKKTIPNYTSNFESYLTASTSTITSESRQAASATTSNADKEFHPPTKINPDSSQTQEPENKLTQPNEAGQLLLEVKKQEIRKTGVLEYVVSQGRGLQEVGGLENVKSWVKTRQKWFEQDTNPEMCPRAILLEGFPGCGKTLIAKAISQELRVPQINVEISRLQSKWVAESDSYTFQALREIEASAPNILFIDELEKTFSAFGEDVAGFSTRQFGTFLSWLYDHEYPIFFIATANDITTLPPELFRAGRFDEIFIFIPPNTQERQEIIQIRSQFYKLPPIPRQALDFLVENTCGFSGAELDKLIKEAIYLAEGYFPTEVYWQEALKQIVPQYRTPKMQILLKKYLKLLEIGWSKPASSIESGFLESLILPADQ